MTRLTLILPILLAGCASADKPVMSQFLPEQDGWRFTARAADLQYPPDDPEAERMRLAWLQEDVIANRACPPNGAYRVAKRTVLHRSTTAIGVGIYEIVYDVECTG